MIKKTSSICDNKRDQKHSIEMLGNLYNIKRNWKGERNEYVQIPIINN